MTNQFSPMRAFAAVLALAVLAGCAAVKPPVQAPVAAPSQSVADADRKLALAQQQRAGAEAAFAASEQVCNAKFLVNRCMDGAREKRRTTLAALRVIEVEAERFKRQAKVDERDQALARSEEEYKANEAKLAAEPPAPPHQAAAPRAPKPVANTQAAQAAKMKKREADDQAGAARRAASVAAYEKRKRESAERQRKIEEKKKAKLSEAEGKK
jgi:colicin import membrane protein